MTWDAPIHGSLKGRKKPCVHWPSGRFNLVTENHNHRNGWFRFPLRSPEMRGPRVSDGSPLATPHPAVVTTELVVDAVGMFLSPVPSDRMIVTTHWTDSIELVWLLLDTSWDSDSKKLLILHSYQSCWTLWDGICCLIAVSIMDCNDPNKSGTPMCISNL